MRFSELSEEAKTVAINDYIRGWKETHPNETLSLQDAVGFCKDTEDDVIYNEYGEVIDIDLILQIADDYKKIFRELAKK